MVIGVVGDHRGVADVTEVGKAQSGLARSAGSRGPLVSFVTGS